ncbi:hypothetical protein TNCV_2773761 [Trichonephila clavipes]|nr:hypothetical protein TNCV_2773761 [Trichonephila clavipes]
MKNVERWKKSSGYNYPLDDSIHVSNACVINHFKTVGIYTSKLRSGCPSKLTIREKRTLQKEHSTNGEARWRWSYDVGVHDKQWCWQVGVYRESITIKYDYLDVPKINLKESGTQLVLESSFRFQHDDDPKRTAEIMKLWLLYNGN